MAKRKDDPTTEEDESLLDEPETESALEPLPDAPESTETNATEADDRFDAVVYIDSLNIPELRDFPKVLDDELGAYRRVPTSVGVVQARIGQWVSSGPSGIHVHNTDPRT